MITYIKITGFKSFHNFEMEFSPLTVLAGPNGSGKSNLFDALQLLSDLTECNLHEAFQKQRGEAKDLFTRYTQDKYAKTMEFTVDMLVDKQVKDGWGNKAILDYTRLRYELVIERNQQKNVEVLCVAKEQLSKINDKEDTWFKEQYLQKVYRKALRPKKGDKEKYFMQTEEKRSITLSQDGKQGRKRVFAPEQTIHQTVLSDIKNAAAFKHACAAREEMRKWDFWQLNPADLREPTKKDIGGNDCISPSGKYLAGTLFRIANEDPYNLTIISRKLNSFLPEFIKVNVCDDTSSKRYIIKLQDVEGREFSSEVLSEGTLRILALCILTYDEKHTGLLCFEEPENGIHPGRMHFMVELLQTLVINFEHMRTDVKKTKENKNNKEVEEEEPIALHQVIVNTHAPKILWEFMNKLLSEGTNSAKERKGNTSIWFTQRNILSSPILSSPRSMYVTRVNQVSKKLELPLFKEKKGDKIAFSKVLDFLEGYNVDRLKKIQ